MASYPPPPGPPPAQHAPLDLSNLSVTDDEYVRNPHKLIGYLVPFPEPNLPADVPPPPLRFLLYTPPPPPLLKPQEGDKEGLSHKVQRKWQEEVKEARTSDAKVASWKGLKGRITKGVAWATDKTTSAQLDFLTRIPKDGTQMSSSPKDKNPEGQNAHEDDPNEPDETSATVKLEELVFLYPSTLAMNPDQIREEFLSTVLRTRKKAEKDAIIATGLLPVSLALDWALIFVGWVFGGAFEVDAVWAASSFRGAKMARSVTKRLGSSAVGEGHLKLTFLPSIRAEPLGEYLHAQCAKRAPARFSGSKSANVPTEQTILHAIGWQPSDQYQEHNWEDEQWEHTQVERDLKTTMHKAAKAWDHWTERYVKHPEKALKK